MKKRITKISLFILIGLIIIACNSTKRVPNGKQLLAKEEIDVDNKLTKESDVFVQLYQKPNLSILGYPFRLNLYNLAKKNPDSSYAVWLNKKPNRHSNLAKLLSEKQVQRLGKSFLVSGLSDFLKETGEAPEIYDTISTLKSVKRLNYYYYNKGYFDVTTKYATDSIDAKRTSLKYSVTLNKPYFIDSLTTTISTPALDSLYKTRKDKSVIKTGKQYNTKDLDEERSRLTTDFRNNGAYFFQQNNIVYTLDTINTNKKVNVNLIIKDYSYRENDSSITAPFKLYKISKVAIFTDHSNSKVEAKIKDSLQYKDFMIYSENKLKYKPKAITDPIFITKGSLFSDDNNILTTRYLSNLRVFNYPTIQYKVDPKNNDALIANIFLTPRKKFTFHTALDLSHSNIYDIGIAGNTSVGIRNIFNGAETFETGLRASIGSSKDLANPYDRLFNISDFGFDSKLSFPRIFFPFKTDKIIPKNMIPSTVISLGFSRQTNIGLDKENFTSIFSYNWTPRKNHFIKFDLLNIQYVRNLNTGNYFHVYESSYETLNDMAIKYSAPPSYFGGDNMLIIESGTDAFLNDVLGTPPAIVTSEEDYKTISSIEERKKRLTENNLIFSSSFSFSKTTKKDLADNSFYAFKTKLESAGNFLSLIANASKEFNTQPGANTIWGVEYSQYIKGEFEYIKHWAISSKQVFAVRGFAGLAVPYGNSNSVPFSRSYFSGGSNDIRAWQPYSLGPGSSGGINDYNEANMKISLNSEFRFNIAGKFNGALFADAGNIWNIFDNITDKAYTFNGVESLKTIALGTGMGLRYDQGLFVVRLDLAFKTFNPAKAEGERWFKELNFSKSVLNIGINYPF